MVVGNYGVGKSSFVKALIGDANANTIKANGEQIANNNNNNDVTNSSNNTKDSQSRPTRRKKRNIDLGAIESSSTSMSNQSDEFEMRESDLIIEPHTILIDAEEVRIIDTAARDVMGTQQQMQSADLVIVLINASSSKSISDLDEYWIDQFNDISLYSPVIACFNQIDRLEQRELSRLKEKFSTPTKEHFVLETMLYVSAYSYIGFTECKQTIITILRNVRLRPRWVLIDPYTWKLQDLFLSALHRIFRLLDGDSDKVLNLQELEYFNSSILHEEFTANAYNFLLRRLNEQNDTFVTTQGLTFSGFKHLMKRFAIAKKWDRCWDVLRFYHYQNDLTLHPRVFPILPMKEIDQTFELSKYVYILLEKLFILYADDTLIDNDNKSIASSMISSLTQQQQQQYANYPQIQQEQQVEHDDDDDDDEGKVLRFEFHIK